MIRGQYDILLAGFVALCLLLGGASAGGLLGNFALQVLAAGLLAFGIATTRGERTGSMQVLLWLAIALFALIALLQFLPLPPGIWAGLPGRGFVAEGFDSLALERPWLNGSLAPYNSLASLAWLLPAVTAAYWGARLLDLRMEVVTVAVCLVALASVPLGAMQVVYGEGSGWYLYQRSGLGQGTGFFANGNHQGTFLLIAITLLAALYGKQSAHGGTPSPTKRLLFAVVLLGLVSGVILTGSMAVIGLLLVVLPACYLLIAPHIALPRLGLLGLAGVAGLTLVLVLAYSGLQQAGTGLQATGPMSRAGIAEVTLDAAWAFFPFGSGIGTFGDVYRMFEDPALVSTTYINHAHNDYLEILLETGLPGALAVALFVAWWIRRSLQLWTAERRSYFALAASLSVGIVLIHSLVDYPLRTAAVSVLFGLSVALMARSSSLWARSSRKHRSGRSKKKKITL